MEIPNNQMGGVRGGWGRDIRDCHFSNWEYRRGQFLIFDLLSQPPRQYNITQPQNCSWVGRENDFAKPHPPQPIHRHLTEASRNHHVNIHRIATQQLSAISRENSRKRFSVSEVDYIALSKLLVKLSTQWSNNTVWDPGQKYSVSTNHFSSLNLRSISKMLV